MRILILNWRDIKNPKGGGAEILTHEMASRWAKWRHQVVQFSEFYPGAKKEEIINGVKIIRRGTANLRTIRLSVHLAAFWWYKKNGKDKFDVVIDEIHGLPFFTPFYIKEKKVALICEVADKIWDVIFQFPFNIIGKFIENNYFRFYKNISFLTISSSTKNDLIEKGVKNENITVLPMGITAPKVLKKYPKENTPTLIFVGRLSKTKGTENAILALKDLSSDIPKIKLWIIGRGDPQYEKYLRELALRYGVENRVTFFGFVSQEKKFELMSRAHLLLVPSTKEGWGLIVSESGLSGTPSIVYKVSGLKDIVKNRVNGLIVEETPGSLAEGVKELLGDKILYEKLQKQAIIEAKKQSWDKTAKVALSVLSSNF